MLQAFSGKKLKEMRKESGLTQAELAVRLGVSRETVIAIEKEHPGTIDSLAVGTLKQWWKVCNQRISQQSRNDFIEYVKNFLNIA